MAQLMLSMVGDVHWRQALLQQQHMDVLLQCMQYPADEATVLMLQLLSALTKRPLDREHLVGHDLSHC